MTTIYDWSVIPGSNANVSGMPMNEGMQPAQVNDSIRAMMAVLAASGQTVATPAMFNVAADGIVDDTVNLQAMFDSGHDILIPPGTYLTGALTVTTNGQNIVISPRATLKMKAGTGGDILTISVDDVQLVGGTFNGNRANVSVASRAIVVSGAARVSINSASVTACKGVGIRGLNCNYLSIVDCNVSDTSDTGIVVEDTLNIYYGDTKVLGNAVDRSAEGSTVVGGGIRVEGYTTAYQVRPVVANNSVAMPVNPSSEAYAIELTKGEFGTLQGNTCTYGGAGYALDNCNNVAVVANVAQGAKTYGVRAISCSSLAITGNNLSGDQGAGPAGDYGVHLQNTTLTTVNGNVIHDMDTAAVGISGTVAGTIDYIDVVGNIFASCTASMITGLSGGAALGAYLRMAANPGYTDYQDYKNAVIHGTCTGTPEGAVTAGVGSIVQRTDGGASTTLYVKESGTGNTGWVAK